jgi:hypothetical protein
MVKVGNYNYELSTKKDKKLMVVVDGKVIHFGDAYSQNYADKTGLLDKKYLHGDDMRREHYLKRAKGIKDKEGKETYKDPHSANWHAVRILW